MTGVLCAMVGAGGSRYAGSATVTVGQYVDVGFYTLWGYAGVLAGSVAPATWANTGATFEQLCWFDAAGDVDFVTIKVNGIFPNEGWTTMTVGGVPFLRTAASYSTDATRTTWNWIYAPNPYGTTIGATKVVTWS